MDREQILLEILQHTKMMESALEAEDFEVFEMLLDARGALIETLEKSDFSSAPEDEVILQQVSEIHERAEKKLQHLKAQTGSELESVRAQRFSMSKARRVQNQYQGYMDTGNSMDTKK